MSEFQEVAVRLSHLSVDELTHLIDCVEEELSTRDKISGKKYTDLTPEEMWTSLVDNAYSSYCYMRKTPSFHTLHLDKLTIPQLSNIISKYITDRTPYSMPSNRLNIESVIKQELEYREQLWQQAQKTNTTPQY